MTKPQVTDSELASAVGKASLHKGVKKTPAKKKTSGKTASPRKATKVVDKSVVTDKPKKEASVKLSKSDAAYKKESDANFAKNTGYGNTVVLSAKETARKK